MRRRKGIKHLIGVLATLNVVAADKVKAPEPEQDGKECVGVVRRGGTKFVSAFIHTADFGHVPAFGREQCDTVRQQKPKFVGTASLRGRNSLEYLQCFACMVDGLLVCALTQRLLRR